ncbi:MAG: type IV pilin protein [Acidobacteriaceae bacterium]
MKTLMKFSQLRIDAQRQAGKRSQWGFTLIELMIVMAVIVILMAIVIPNAMNLRKQAYETSAIQSIRAINGAEIQYQSTYPANGFACSLAALGGPSGAGQPGPTAAQLIPPDLSTGQKSGYTFAISNCSKVTINNQDMFTSYAVTAVPQAVGKTGNRGFCSDQSGEIKADPAGGTNCTQPIQ